MVICSVFPLKKRGKTRRMCEDVHEMMLKFIIHTETWERLSWTLRLWDSFLQSEFTTGHTWRIIHFPNSKFEEEIHGPLKVNLTLHPKQAPPDRNGKARLRFCSAKSSAVYQSALFLPKRLSPSKHCHATQHQQICGNMEISLTVLALVSISRAFWF